MKIEMRTLLVIAVVAIVCIDLGSSLESRHSLSKRDNGPTEFDADAYEGLKPSMTTRKMNKKFRKELYKNKALDVGSRKKGLGLYGPGGSVVDDVTNATASNETVANATIDANSPVVDGNSSSIAVDSSNGNSTILSNNATLIDANSTSISNGTETIDVKSLNETSIANSTAAGIESPVGNATVETTTTTSVNQTISNTTSIDSNSTEVIISTSTVSPNSTLKTEETSETTTTAVTTTMPTTTEDQHSSRISGRKGVDQIVAQLPDEDDDHDQDINRSRSRGDLPPPLVNSSPSTTPSTTTSTTSSTTTPAATHVDPTPNTGLVVGLVFAMLLVCVLAFLGYKRFDSFRRRREYRRMNDFLIDGMYNDL